MRRARLKACLLLLLLLLPGRALGGGLPESRTEHMARAYGSVFYAALYALPETEPVFEGFERTAGWRHSLPSALALPSIHTHRIDARLVRFLHRLPAEKRRSVLGRIGYWCAAHAILLEQTRVFQSSSSEKRFAVLFTLEPLRREYIPYLEARGAAPNAVDPAWVGATLSSQEQVELTYSLLNKVSSLPESEQLLLYSEFFRAWKEISL